jgi:hypothetical protein
MEIKKFGYNNAVEQHGREFDMAYCSKRMRPLET